MRGLSLILSHPTNIPHVPYVRLMLFYPTQVAFLSASTGWAHDYPIKEVPSLATYWLFGLWVLHVEFLLDRSFWCPLDSEKLWCYYSFFLSKAPWDQLKSPKPCGTLTEAFTFPLHLCGEADSRRLVPYEWKGVHLAMPPLSNKEKTHFTLKPWKCALGFIGWSLFWKFHGQNQQSCGMQPCGCGMFRIKCLVFQVSQAPSKASQWFAERFCVGFILNGTLECGSYLHFIGISITKPSYLGTSQ